MRLHTETERLLLRDIEQSDAEALFKLDSDPEVHRYLGGQPVQHIDQIREVIDFIRGQYKENGIGRWAVVEKASGQCIGWAGLKYYREPINDHVNIYELGYRLIRAHWGKGFATEASQASIRYGFEVLQQDMLYAIVHPENTPSQNVLKKCGFQMKGHFLYNGTEPHYWLELQKPA